MSGTATPTKHVFDFIGAGFKLKDRYEKTDSSKTNRTIPQNLIRRYIEQFFWRDKMYLGIRCGSSLEVRRKSLTGKNNIVAGRTVLLSSIGSFG
jgi:hypothetical protein